MRISIGVLVENVKMFVRDQSSPRPHEQSANNNNG